MLSEITIRDFAIIDHLTLRFSPGFNVLTGETGAGKSIILDAVSLLLGGRASHDDIRAGAESALVEGIFILRNESTREAINALLEREALEGDAPDLLVLTREVRRGGRNICRVNGRVVTLSILQEISEGLVDIHGQTEHLSLLKPAYHLDLLDRYGGLMEKRRAFSQLVRQVEAVRAELHNLITNRDELAMRAEMLNYKVEEIRTANLKPGEEEDLRDEARRLANAEQIAELVSEAYQAIYVGGEGRGSAADLLTEAANALARLVKLDPAAEEMSTLAEELSIQAEELSRSLADYQANIEFDPARLQEAELRLTSSAASSASTMPTLSRNCWRARSRRRAKSRTSRTAASASSSFRPKSRAAGAHRRAASELSKLRQACADGRARGRGGTGRPHGGRALPGIHHAGG